jgi:GNAT superfamily N-acetyltransferase
MAKKKPLPPVLEIHSLTPERWENFEQLFGPRGACGGCWCMTWRLKRSIFNQQKGEGNRTAMKALVEGGAEPGLLGYVAGRPVAWCAVAPREEYPALERSRILKPLDEQPVWSVSCLFVEKSHRKQGISVAMLKAAVDFVRERGGRIVEGYPYDLPAELPPPFVWTGLASAFLRAGYTEVARRSNNRPIMRFVIVE